MGIKTNNMSDTIKKEHLVDSIHEKADVSKKDAANMLKAFQETVTENLIKGNRVVLVGFGQFNKIHKDGRTGRNPQTGDALQIPAQNVVKFKVGKELKGAVN